MKVCVTKTRREFDDMMAQMILKHMISDAPRVNLSITAGITPIEGYKILAAQIKDKAWFDNVHYYLFDDIYIRGKKTKSFHEVARGEKPELYPVKNPDAGIVRENLDWKFFDPAGVKADHIHDITEENYETIDQEIERAGGLDMIIMGLGGDGHICGNLPGTVPDWSQTARKVPIHTTTGTFKMVKSCLTEYNLTDESLMPEFYVSFGPKTVLNARNAILIATGPEKADIVEKVLCGPVTREVPASVLQLHQHLTVLLDEDAAAKLPASLR
ncbi:6-phosphogluconolactonase [Caproiciproducens sp.]